MKGELNNIYIPSQDEFFRGVEEFIRYEKRDSMYKVATFLISHFWGKSTDMADGLGVLLLTWNQAFYRFGIFDFDKLEICISKNLLILENFRKRNISSLSRSDEDDIEYLFNEFLLALQIHSGKSKGRRSPVAVAKALHLLAPNFFPIWDHRIAKAYRCYYDKYPAEQYILFCKIMKVIAVKIKGYIASTEKSILKLIDEYNYSKYTKVWI
ncbi:hypothetical protein ES702_03693 [subsurface metagenome]